MPLKESINNRRPTRDLIEKKVSDKETYLLKALLYLLLYTGHKKEGEGLTFTGADSPSSIPFNLPIG